MNSNNIKYRTVTWSQLHQDARDLAQNLMDSYPPFKGLVAVTRGGMVPTSILAREMGIRLVESISVVSYAAEEGTQQEPKLLKAPTAAGDGEGFLIVDDLVDSGVTAQFVRHILPKAVFVSLYAKPDGMAYTDHYIAEVDQDTWVLFPWDTAPMFIPPLRKNQ